jgi:hypothetical protein
MSNIKKLVIDVTAVDIGTPLHLNETPLAGGEGREAKYQLNALPLTSVIAIQGNNKQGTAVGTGASYTPPAENDTGWETILTLNSASDRVGEIPDLPRWLRASVTTADADGPDVILFLEGVQ